MNVRVGIPRAMLYHEFGSLWSAYFENMGIPVCISGETNKQTLDRGTVLATDESCLPLKVYLGHVESLLSECSHVFVPRIAQYHNNFHFCAKFAGLPDIVRNTFRLSSRQLIVPNIENRPMRQLRAIHATCSPLGLAVIPGYLTYLRTLRSWKTGSAIRNGPLKPKIAVIGHSYLLNDALFCHDIMKVLASRGVSVVTPDHVADRVLYAEAKTFAPDVYWQLSAKLTGAARYFCRQPDIAGIIMVSCFGCGPDSLVNEYVKHHVLKQSNKPHIIVNIDEHTGSAGLITRIEAFWDLVELGAKL